MLLEPLLVIALAATAGFAVVLAHGARRWEAGSRELRARLEAARAPVAPLAVDFADLENLPDVVQRYFRTVLRNGQPMVSAVSVEHRGSFNLGENGSRWKPFTSDQRVVTRRPGFDWDARIAMLPGLQVRVHDAYVTGSGLLHASLGGVFELVELRGRGDIAEGELMRFLAEAAWYPTALLPSQGVQWEAAGDRSARATLVDEGVAVSLLFRFNESGLIDSARAEGRGRRVAGTVVATPWQGQFRNYVEREGMLVPLEGEVAWLLPTGPLPYWRGRITRLEYEFAPSPRRESRDLERDQAATAR